MRGRRRCGCRLSGPMIVEKITYKLHA